MAPLQFEWDPRKAAANLRKHGVDFAEATTVFGDPLSLTIPDRTHSAGELRWAILGLSHQRKLLVVVHTLRDDRIRLISARPAARKEQRDYAEIH
jgi:uncharacterized protein